MRRFAMIIVLALTTAMPRAAAYAAKPSGSSKPAEIELATYASCMAKKSPKAVNAYLRAGSQSASIGKMSRAMADSSCLSSYEVSQLRMSGPLMRWALYEALYDSRFAKTAPIDLSASSKLDFASEREGMSSTETTGYLYIRDFGDCVARSNAPGAHALLATQIHSAKEKQAFEAVMPSLNACLVGKGDKTSFTRTSIRGIVAEALYKLRLSGSEAKPSPP